MALPVNVAVKGVSIERTTVKVFKLDTSLTFPAAS